MVCSRFRPKEYEHNFFIGAFKIIDEQAWTQSDCLAVYRRLASQAPDGVIKNWNYIPLWRIRQTGFGGYKQTLQEIFRHLINIYKISGSEQTRGQVEQLLREGVGILKRRITEVERGRLLADAEVTGNHLNVIELWSRCLKESMEEGSTWIPYRKELEFVGYLVIAGVFVYFLYQRLTGNLMQEGSG